MSIIRRLLRGDKVCSSCGGYASNGWKCAQCMRLGK
jgi:hypothetical protein